MMTRTKIIPEDLIQKTNLQQHNFMIDAINSIDERQKDVDDINTAISAEFATLKNDVVILNNVKYDKNDAAALEQEFEAFPDEVQTMIIDSLDTELKSVLVDDDMLKFSADKKAIFLQKNRRDGGVIDEQIPLSTRQNVGLATPEDLQAIDGLSTRVTTLENSGITGELFYLNHDFSGITDAVRTVHFNADIGKPPVVGDSVVDNQQKSWRFVITGPATFGWTEVPHLSIGGDLKAVKSSNADGKVYVESDNTCSVVGWNGVKNDISGNTSAIGAHAGSTTNPHGVTKAQVGLGAYPTSPADIGISTATQNALNAKQDKMTFDDAPVAGSDNVVKSGGIKAYIDEQVLLAVPQVKCSELSTMFKGDTSLIETSIIKAIGCTSLEEVFKGCINLKTVNRIIAPNVTTMSSMFSGCSSLTTVHGLDTSNVIYMSSMFNGCSALTTVPALDMSNVTDTFKMFNGCSALTTVHGLDTSNVTNMSNIFNGCSALTTVPALDMNNVTNARSMFYGCSSLLSVPEMDMSNVTITHDMFANCSALTSVTFTGNAVPPYGTNMFLNTPIASGNGTIYVPDNLVSSYKNASGWSAHASVIKGISEKP